MTLNSAMFKLPEPTPAKNPNDRVFGGKVVPVDTGLRSTTDHLLLRLFPSIGQLWRAQGTDNVGS
ncbi:hypothetical protein EP837_02998 [Sphingobium sp. EP60837]|nr:hypothetical protein EP837_02998 [Sphingobium sp. EP60837]